MSVIRIGSIGLGGISKGVHLPGIHRSPDLQQVALCDINPEALNAVGDQYGIDAAHRFADYHDLIACPDVDAIDITTPNCLHYDIAMAAVAAGKPYCLEKPMTMDAAQADRLAAATKEAGLKSMICFSYRYRSAARYAKELIAKGVLGRIYHVDVQYYQAWGLPQVNCPLRWRFEKAKTGSGALGDLGSHALDLVRFVTGQDFAKVTGHLGTFVFKRPAMDGNGMKDVDVDDFSNCMAELKDGCAVTMRITRLGYGRGNYQYMEIYGDNGAMVYTLDANGSGVDRLEVCLDPLGMENHRFTDVPIPARHYMDQMQSFADLLNGKGDGLTATVEDGRVNMHVVDAILASGENGKWMEP